MIYSIEKSIKDLGDKASPEDKAKTEEAIADLRRAMESGDIQAIKDKTEALKQASYKIAEELYKQQGAQGAAGPGPEGAAPGAEPNDNSAGGNTKSAEDADYEVVDDDK